jgi:hypothetical protein
MKRILLAAGLCSLLGLGGLSAQAALQPPGGATPAGPPRQAQPLENGPAVAPAPRLVLPPSAPSSLDPHWRANVRANTDSTTFAQQEPSIGVNPLNPLNVVVANKDERSAPGPNTATKEVWIETSTDGGLTWPVQTRIPMPDTTRPQQSDPIVTFSDDNSVYVTIIGLSNSGGLGTNSTMVARSTDGGLTWPTPAVVVNPGQGGSDKEWTAVDLNPASPYYHRVYVTWTNFAAGPAFIEKWSSDNGVSWNPPGSAYVTVSFGSHDNGQFSMPVVVPNTHTVVATWNDFGGHIAVGRSTNGGQAFINPNTTAVNITDANPVPGAAWRLNTIPATVASPASSTLVSVWADGRNGKADIYYTRSTDDGLTWSAAARVAHNTAGSSYQVEPWVSAAPNGRFDAIWYDDRDFPSNLNTFHIYASHSTDDGATWTSDEQVTDAPSNLNVGIPGGSGWNGAAGDYIGVTSLNNVAYAVWTDTRSGTNEDAYTSAYVPVQGTPTPTVTGTPPTATPTRTATQTPVATATPCAIPGVIQNGGFETGSLTPWVVQDTNPAPVISAARAHSGTSSALVGTVSGAEPNGNGSLYQGFTVPAGATLSFWYYPGTTDTISFDWQDVYLTDSNGAILATILHACENDQTWKNVTFNLAPYVGQSVRVKFLVHQDGFGDDTYMYVDEVGLQGAVCGSPVPTSTATVTATATNAPSNTPLPTTTAPPATATAPAATATATAPAATATAPAATRTPGATATPCNITFSDVHPTDYFYTPVQYLACHGVISGYADGTFRPYNNTTRSQMVKIVVLGFNIPSYAPPNTNTFADVPPANPFFSVIEAAAHANIVSGYTCGTVPGEPCDSANRPYFRPFANVTRGQLSKIVVVAAGWTPINPAVASFQDVFPNTAFYTFVETAYCHGIISGYDCGGPGEPCGTSGKPYFRQFNDATRGQIAKIVYGALTSTQTCATP